jgi:hypothetical protein
LHYSYLVLLNISGEGMNGGINYQF